MATFTGKWKYQSYRPEPVTVMAGATPPTLVPWSPPGVVTIDAGGATGKLVFPETPIKLDLTIQVTEGSPARLAISAVMNLTGGKQFTNELQGWFVPAETGKDGPLVVRGSIVQTSASIAPPLVPIFTTGFFVLEPLP
jgi:hypothetical protein